MQQVRPRVSFADLERLPDDGRRRELYDGEVFVMPSPTRRHQRVVVNILEVFRDYERACGGEVVISPFDIVLTQHNMVQPDIVFFVQDRATLLNQLGPARIPPDLAVEVLSPGTTSNDRGRKMHLLARFGVGEYWIVDPIGNTVERYVLDGEAYVLDAILIETDTITARTLPGLTCPAARIFAK